MKRASGVRPSTQYAEQTDELTRELEQLMAKPRTPITEKKIRKLIKKAGWPETAKTMFKRRHGGRP